MVKVNNTQKYRVGKNKYLKRLNQEKVDKVIIAEKKRSLYSITTKGINNKKCVIRVRGGHNTNKKLVSNIIGRYNFYYQNSLPKEINDMIELQVQFAQQTEDNLLIENTFSSSNHLVPWDALARRMEWRAKVQSEQQFKAFNSLQNNEVIANYFHNPQVCLIEVPVWRSPRNN